MGDLLEKEYYYTPSEHLDDNYITNTCRSFVNVYLIPLLPLPLAFDGDNRRINSKRVIDLSSSDSDDIQKKAKMRKITVEKLSPTKFEFVDRTTLFAKLGSSIKTQNTDSPFVTTSQDILAAVKALLHDFCKARCGSPTKPINPNISIIQ